MVYLIGIAHRAQARTTGSPITEAQEQFKGILQKAVATVPPILIAEEDSEEALASRQAISIAKEIADTNGIEHRFCDPTQAQRSAIGYRDGATIEVHLWMQDQAGLPNDVIRLKGRAIEIGRYFPLRERFWLERIPESHEHNVLFICGDGHIESFKNLLDSEGVPHKTVKQHIGLTDEDLWFADAVRYLQEHPEVLDEDPFIGL